MCYVYIKAYQKIIAVLDTILSWWCDKKTLNDNKRGARGAQSLNYTNISNLLTYRIYSVDDDLQYQYLGLVKCCSVKSILLCSVQM